MAKKTEEQVPASEPVVGEQNAATQAQDTRGMIEDAEPGKTLEWDNEKQGGAVRVDVPAGPTLADLMTLMKQQHLAVTSQMQGMNERVGRLEDAEHTRKVERNATHTDTTFDSGIRTMRCEDCNAIFEGVWTYGGSMRCASCSMPGATVGHCPCGKRFSRQKDGPIRCQQCIDCPICGTKASEIVCGMCVRKGAKEHIYVCNCGRQCPPDSARGMCKKCEREFLSGGAQTFTQGDKPDGDPLVTDAVDQRAEVLRTNAFNTGANRAPSPQPITASSKIFMG